MLTSDGSSDGPAEPRADESHASQARRSRNRFLGMAAIMTLLSSNSAVGLAASAIAGRCYAHSLSLEEFGILGLAQCLLMLLALIAGMGVPMALVRLGALHHAGGRVQDMVELRRSAYMLMVPVLALLAAAAWWFRKAIADSALGGASQEWLLLYLVPAAALSHAAALEISYLIATRKVLLIVKGGIISTAIGTLAGIAAIVAMEGRGIGLCCLALPLTQLLTYRLLLLKDEGRGQRRPGTAALADPRAVRSLLGVALPVGISALVGSGAALLIPGLITRTDRPRCVGILPCRQYGGRGIPRVPGQRPGPELHAAGRCAHLARGSEPRHR